MKSKLLGRSLALVASGLLGTALLAALGSAHAATYTWRGTNSTVWGTPGNWLAQSVGPTNGNYNHRLDVNNAGFSALEYTAAQGTTVYGQASPGIRGFVVGSGGNGSGTFTISGGTFITTNGSGGDLVGNSDNNTGTLNISGGTLISGSSTFAIGLGGGLNRTSVLNVNSGSATVGNISINTLRGTINLNGGTLAASNIVVSSIAGVNATNNFNGGTLKARGNSTGFFPLAPLAVVQVNVRDGGAVIDTDGFNITVAQPLRHSAIAGDAAIDGGLIKNGGGLLTLNGTNTYTGQTVVNQGSLAMKLPSSSSSLTVADGAAASLTVNDSSWTTTAVNLTNATLNFAFGAVVSLPTSIIPTTTLNASGANVINITSGAGLPIGETKLIDHAGNKFGGGSFTLGTLPPGMQAGLVDGATSVSLMVTSSVQALVWSGSVNNEWATNGLLNWNSGAASYQEYVSGFGDLVTFSDAAGLFYTVNLTNDVKPLDVIVSIPTAAVTFNGNGRIVGDTGLAKSGAGILTLANTNSYNGVTAVSGGTLQVLNGFALGSTTGATVISGNGSGLASAGVLAIGDGFSSGVVVSGETVSIGYSTVNAQLARGALRGVDSGNNVWAGPVIVAANEARIGTEDGGYLEVSGPITESGTNFTLLLRPGANGTLVFSGTGSSYGQTRTFGDISGTGLIKLGANNALSTNLLNLNIGTLDLNGNSQTVGGLARTDSNGPGNMVNNGASPSTLTINTSSNNYSCDSSLMDGANSLAIVKLGSGQQTLNPANLTYSGTTTISAGRLHLAPTNAMVSSISVAAGATLSGEPTTTGSLTLSANSAIIADPGTPGSLTASAISASVGPINVSFSSAFPPGDVLVLTASGGITGSAGNFQGTGVRGGSFYLTNSNTELYFSPSAGPTLVWKGNSLTNATFWDVTTTTNWDNSGSPDTFYTGDGVLFNDTASTYDVVIQGASVAPASVAFNNSVSNYTITGGAISGTATLTKSGAGTVTLSGNNSYSGVTVIEGGSLIAQNNNALGSKIAGTVVTNGGTLDLGGNVFAGGFSLGSELLTVSGAGVGAAGAVVNNSPNIQINAVQQMVLAGNASLGGLTRWDMRGTGNALNMGGFNLTKTGPGYIGLVATLIANPGNINIAAGTLSLQLTNDLAGSAANSLTVQDGGTLSFYQHQLQAGWSLILNSNATVGCESFNAANGGTNHWAGPVTMSGLVNFTPAASMSFGSGLAGSADIIKTGAGYVRLFGTNSYTGNTTVNAGRLVFFTPTIPTNSTLAVASGAGVELQFTETNAIDGLVLGGVAKGPGVYNNGTDPTFLFGSGSLMVTGSLIPTTPTNITYSVTSTSMTLTWPAEYTGWYLQSQTNSLNVGLSGNWANVAGSETTNSITVPISLTDPAVFFRMVHTNAP